jgi:hypothetical protein
MSWHKEWMIEVCESVENATGIDFDIVQDYVLKSQPDAEFGEWLFYNLSNTWFGFKEERPVKVVFGKTLEEVKKKTK